jgi:hypothetical protein
MTQTFCDICGIPIDNNEKYTLELTKKVFYKDNTPFGQCQNIKTQLIRKMDVCTSCANKIEGYVDYDINEIFEEKGN